MWGHSKAYSLSFTVNNILTTRPATFFVPPTSETRAASAIGVDAASAEGQGLQTTYLSHCVLRDGCKVGRGEGETTVCPCIMWVKIEDHLLLPAASLAQVQTIDAHKPVRAGDNTYHEGHLDGTGRFSSCSNQDIPSPVLAMTYQRVPRVHL